MSIFAHRGASGYAPENTLAAFELAVNMGADGIEFDVHLSADGVPVVIHDETLERTTGRVGWVKDFTAAELSTLEVPTLETLFGLMAGEVITLHVELKDVQGRSSEMATKVLDMINKWRLRDRVVISSSNHATLSLIRETDPTIRLGFTFTDALLEPWNNAKQVGATALHPCLAYVKAVPGVIEKSHAEGLEVNVWTENETPTTDWSPADGADGIFTDFPDLLVASCKSR